MEQKIIISADSTCDLGPELKERYQVAYFPLHIIVEDQDYMDSVDITPEEIYAKFRENGSLPKTAAISVGEYVEYFKDWVHDGYEVVHINLGAALSASYQNCVLAAEQLGHVYPIDSKSLSTGAGHLVIEAARRAKAGLPAAEIAAEVAALTGHVHASFILDTLAFLKAGGRCSSLAALGANLLSLKPCIEVVNDSGAMKVGKKYRGKLDKVLLHYTADKLAQYPDIRKDKIFITHSGICAERVQAVREVLQDYGFAEIFETVASCTISSHCGPNTLGILFMTETPAK